jgi:hypothetical protein
MRRRRPRTTPPVPVVLPFVEVRIDPDGKLTITVDREPYDSPANVVPVGRPALARLLDDITSRLASPVRVEVHEADGAVFTDIITPRPAPAAEVSEPAELCPALPSGGGFNPGEEVAVAIVVTQVTADRSGSASVRLPAALLAKHRGAVVLVGRTSGTVAFGADALDSVGVA